MGNETADKKRLLSCLLGKHLAARNIVEMAERTNTEDLEATIGGQADSIALIQQSSLKKEHKISFSQVSVLSVNTSACDNGWVVPGVVSKPLEFQISNNQE